MTHLSSGGFTQRTDKTEAFVQTVEKYIFTSNRYFNIQTGIEHRFADKAKEVQKLLYRSMGPTTDLLRYFPDNLYLDRMRRWPTWETQLNTPETLTEPVSEEGTGLFAFFVEYKFSFSERKQPLKGVPTPYIGILEREAWLTYKRLTAPNPKIDIYLDSKFTNFALFYAATYAPEKLYAGWEHQIEPIRDDPNAIRRDIAQPKQRSVSFSTGSGTPWINFDIRLLKPMERFLMGDLFWDKLQAIEAIKACKTRLFG
jgi:hypothetical protein